MAKRLRAEVISRPKIGLETLRTLFRFGFRVAAIFVNLDAVEQGLLNSRLIEYPFVIRRLSETPVGSVLDVGCTDGGNVVAPTLAELGWQVYGSDIREWRYTHPNFHFELGDISRGMRFADDFFDCAYAISSIEHFGLSGRYGVTELDPEAPYRAVREIARILKPGGRFLLTIPYGSGGVVSPAERVFSRETLGRLIDGWSVQELQFWYLDGEGNWSSVSEAQAGQTRTPGGVCVAMLDLENAKGTQPVAG